MMFLLMWFFGTLARFSTWWFGPEKFSEWD